MVIPLTNSNVLCTKQKENRSVMERFSYDLKVLKTTISFEPKAHHVFSKN